MLARLCLASTSPRRHELLSQLGLQFSILAFRTGDRADFDTDETPYDDEDALHYVERIALSKAEAGVRRLAWRDMPLQTVLAADTIVLMEGEIFGKPKDEADAIRMLTALCGNTHQVYTAIAASNGRKTRSIVQCNHVTLAPLSREHIRQYVERGESYDKAGAYAVQGFAASFVRHIEGSYSGIMGLPLFETCELLAEFGHDVLDTARH